MDQERDGQPSYAKQSDPMLMPSGGQPEDLDNPRGKRAETPPSLRYETSPSADAELAKLGASIASRGYSDESPVSGRPFSIDIGTETDPANIDINRRR